MKARAVFFFIVIALLINACSSSTQAPQTIATPNAISLPSPTPPPDPTTAASPATALSTAPNSAPTETLTTPAEPTAALAIQPKNSEGAPANQPASEPADPTSSPVIAGAEDCRDAAAFFEDVTVPDGTLFRPGESFTKTWRVSNVGTCAWGNGYAIVFAGSEILNAAAANPLPAAAPGEVVNVSVDMKAPNFGGQYVSHWLFTNPKGQTFGVGHNNQETMWALIKVTYTGGETPVTAGNPVNGSTPANASPNLSGNPTPSGATPPAAILNPPGALTPPNVVTPVNVLNPTSPPTFPSGSVAPPVGCSAQRNSTFESQLLTLINKSRQAAGLQPLSLRKELSNAAQVHSFDMACKSLLSHVGSDGANWYARVAAQGYANSSSARENIYAGSPDFGGDPQGALNWWMNSQIHRDNILNPQVTEIGIGYAFSASSQFGGYYTLIFAKPWDR